MAAKSKPVSKSKTATKPSRAKTSASLKSAAKPATVPAYLASLPADRRAAISAVRDTINRRLPQGYVEGIQYGMIGWAVPHSLFPPGYHCDPRQPLPFAALASQKNHMSLHLMFVYGSEEQRTWFQGAWERTGKKLDMGKACVRFKSLDDVAIDVVGDAVARVPVAAYVAKYTAMLKGAAPSKR